MSALPNDELAERALLGHSLNLGRIPEDVNGLAPSDFYQPVNETIWATMGSLSDQSKPCDLPSVVAHLDKLGQLERGKPQHNSRKVTDLGLFELQQAPPIVDPAHAARNIQEHARRRQLILLHQRGLQQAHNPASDPEELLRGVEAEIGHMRGAAEDSAHNGRWVNLDQFLDGTYTPPLPSLGGDREDGVQFLYPERWHTLVALTAAGKTTFALWEVKAILASGGHVVYIHFEEANPNGIIHRLKALGVDSGVIRKQLHWGHVDTPWKWGEMVGAIEQLEVPPQLGVLDGINAACGMHDWAVKEPESVGKYRAVFVYPLTKVGAAVLSLGHPPKAVNRQSESYGYGAAGWLNDVDGVGYRMAASKAPIGKGRKGSSALYSVKDRYGEVERWGEPQPAAGAPASAAATRGPGADRVARRTRQEATPRLARRQRGGLRWIEPANCLPAP